MGINRDVSNLQHQSLEPRAVSSAAYDTWITYAKPKERNPSVYLKLS